MKKHLIVDYIEVLNKKRDLHSTYTW